MNETTTFKQKVKHGWDVSVGRMGKLAEQPHMAALRDGFALILPLIIAASIGVIMMTFVFGWWDTVSTSILGWIAMLIDGQTIVNADTNVIQFAPGSLMSEISAYGTFIFYPIWKGVFSFLSLFITLTISYSMARTRNAKDPFIACLVGLAAFLILTYGDANLFGANGMLVAILSSLVSMELYTKFEKTKKLELKMPTGVPPAVARSFSKLFPAIFTLLIMLGIQAPFVVLNALLTSATVGDSFGIGHAISGVIQAPFLGLASSNSGSLALGLIYTMAVGTLWFFGVHGTNVLEGIFKPIFISLMGINLAYRTNPIENPNFSAIGGGSIDAYVFFGGAGVTLAFVLLALFLSKSKATREVIKFGGPAAIFNINEPILFGIPMILNFKFFIPFVFISPILYVMTWLSIEVFKFVPPTIIMIPWTSPVIVGGFLAGGWQGAVLAAFNFIIALAIYTPFILMANKSAKKNNEELVKIDYKEGFNKIKSKIMRKKQGENNE